MFWIQGYQLFLWHDRLGEDTLFKASVYLAIFAAIFAAILAAIFAAISLAIPWRFESPVVYMGNLKLPRNRSKNRSKNRQCRRGFRKTVVGNWCFNYLSG